MKNLKKRELELEAEPRQSSKHAAVAKVRGDAVKIELSTIKGVLGASLVKVLNLRWDRNEMVSKTQQSKVDVKETL